MEKYIELNFVDKNVVQLVNQQGTYQTIASEAYVELANGVRLNLADKSIVDGEEEKLTLAQMVIDSDDNIEIIEKTEEELLAENEEEDAEAEENEANEAGAGGAGATSNVTNTTNDSSSNTNNNSSSIVIEGGAGGTGDGSANNNTGNDSETGGDENEGGTGSGDNTDPGEIPENPEEDTEVTFPVFEVTDFTSDVISMSASIMITDDDGILESATTVKIVEAGTNKIVYQPSPYEQGVYDISLSTSNLEPDKEYTLIANADYKYKDETYNRDFVSKVFRTDDIGISFSKNYVDENELSINVNVESYSSITDASLSIYEADGETRLGSELVDVAAAKENGQNTYNFSNLNSNTEYILKLENISYNSMPIEVGGQEKSFKTLKRTPEIGIPTAETDAVSGSFTLYLQSDAGNGNGVSDPDQGITSYRYEIYNVDQIGDDGQITGNPVKTVEKSDASGINLPVDGQELLRTVPYTFRVIANFEDNEKVVELSSGFSGQFSLDATASYPYVEFAPMTDPDTGEEIGVKSESIEGSITIRDAENTIEPGSTVMISISGNDGTPARTQEWNNYDSTASFALKVTNLQANTQYTVSLSGWMDLKDGNGYVKRYIGSFTVKTDETKNIRVMTEALDEDIQSAFDVSFQLGQESGDVDNTHEALILNNLRLVVYPGDNTSGTAVGACNLTNTQSYDPDDFTYDGSSSDMKANYYDNAITLTPKSFGCDNASFTAEDHYTVVVEDGTDYTDFGNKIHMVNESNEGTDSGNAEDASTLCTFVIYPHGFVPDAPRDTNNAIAVTEKLNGQQTNPDSNLSSNTIVGYTADANESFPTTGMRYAKTVTYNAYKVTGGYDGGSRYPDADASSITSERVKSETLTVDSSASELPVWDLTVGNGSGYDLQRGYVYYFTYTVQLDLKISADGNSIPADYPTDAANADSNTVLRSLIYKCPKESPVFYSYLADTGKAGNAYNLTWKYRYKDVDSAYSADDFVSTSGTASGFASGLGSEDTGTLTVTGVTPGDVEVKKGIALYDQPAGYGGSETTLLKHKISTDIGSSLVSKLNYSVETDASKLWIRFNHNNPTPEQQTLIDQISGLKITVTDTEQQDSQKVFDYVPVSAIGAGVSLMDIKEMLGHSLDVQVEAYYDGVLAGTAQAESGNLVMLQYYNRTDGYLYEGKSSDAAGSLHVIDTMPSEADMFSQTGAAQMFSGKRYNNTDSDPDYEGDDKSYSFRVDTQGLNTNTNSSNPASDTYYVIKDAAVTTLNNEAPDAVIRFDYIYPTVSSVNATVGVTDAVITMEYDGVDASEIAENKLYLQFTDQYGNSEGDIYPLYQHDLGEDGYKGTVKYEIGADEEGNYPALEPGKTYYYIIYVIFENDDAGEIRRVLDSDQGNTSVIYSFTTADEVKFTNTEYSYSSIDYDRKYMYFYFDVDIVTGYSVHFELTDTDATPETKIDLGDRAEMDTFIQADRNNLRLPVGLNDQTDGAIPGRADLVYGHNYKLTAVAKTAAGTEVGSFEIPFLLEELEEPYVSQFNTAAKDSIDYTVTISDPDFAMVGGEYTVAVYEGDSIDESKLVGVVEQYKLDATDASDLPLNSAVINIKREKLKTDTTYTLVVSAQVNSSYTEDGAEPFQKVFTSKTLNDYGVGFGDIFGSVVDNNGKKQVQLDFYSLIGSNQITSVDYTIFKSGSGSVLSASGERVTFKDAGESSGEKVQTLTLASDVSDFESGKYEIKIVFKNATGAIIDTKTVTFQYSSSRALSWLMDLFSGSR